MIPSGTARFVGAMLVMADPVDSNNVTAQADGFSLSRWSRLKRAGAVATPAPESSQPPAEAAPTGRVVTSRSGAQPASADAANAADVSAVSELSLPPLSSVSLTEDFTPFMQAKVPQALRQQALKALFREPHFNVMDGLDTYTDDYTQFEPIAPEVMATLSSWKTIMNPPTQVVTPGGYAVDAESDEGRAVLAARDEMPADEMATAPDDEGSTRAAISESADTERAAAPAAHPRYGKRVGDFAGMQQMETTALVSTESGLVVAPAETTLIPGKHA